jgi:hypothetical protein
LKNFLAALLARWDEQGFGMLKPNWWGDAGGAQLFGAVWGNYNHSLYRSFFNFSITLSVKFQGGFAYSNSSLSHFALATTRLRPSGTAKNYYMQIRLGI